MLNLFFILLAAPYLAFLFIVTYISVKWKVGKEQEQKYQYFNISTKHLLMVQVLIFIWVVAFWGSVFTDSATMKTISNVIIYVLMGTGWGWLIQSTYKGYLTIWYKDFINK